MAPKMMMLPSAFTVLYICLLALQGSESFVIVQRHAKTVTPFAAVTTRLQASSLPPPPPPPPENMPDEENAQYSSEVDWDAEWKKVVQNQGKTTVERPGKDFYKTEAEIAAIRATNKAAQEASRLASSIEIPTWDSVKGDWKFWVGVLAVVSFGGALLSAVAGDTNIAMPSDSTASPDSYFI